MAWPDDYFVRVLEWEKVEEPSGYRLTVGRGGRRIKLAGPYTPSVEPPTAGTDFDIEQICADIKADPGQQSARLETFLGIAAYDALP
jgi:hypothetical protein